MDLKTGKKIRTIGIIVIVVSVLILFGNVMSVTSFRNPDHNTASNMNSGLLIRDYYLIFILSRIFLATFSIVGGVGIIRYKNWARILLILSSYLFILSVIITSAFLIVLSLHAVGIFGVLIPIVPMLILLFPLILLVRYLTRDNTKINFA